MVYGEGSDGLYYSVREKVEELTTNDIAYMNRMINGIRE